MKNRAYLLVTIPTKASAKFRITTLQNAARILARNDGLLKGYNLLPLIPINQSLNFDLTTSLPMSPTINIRLTIPFFMVCDMKVSLKFYTEQLGFKLTNQWTPRGKIDWCWLERDAASLMLQEYHDAEKFESFPKGNGVSICFQCADALALYHEFTEKGVEINEPFVGNNMWVVNFKDPDGYKLDFESPTDVSEETTYTEWMKKTR
jgi:lactoylglutathione lyase